MPYTSSAYLLFSISVHVWSVPSIPLIWPSVSKQLLPFVCFFLLYPPHSWPLLSAFHQHATIYVQMSRAVYGSVCSVWHRSASPFCEEDWRTGTGASWPRLRAAQAQKQSQATQRRLTQCGSCILAPLSSSLSICLRHTDCTDMECQPKGWFLLICAQAATTIGCNLMWMFVKLVHVWFLNPWANIVASRVCFKWQLYG